MQRTHAVICLLCIALFGCGTTAPPMMEEKPQTVLVSFPVEKEVTDYAEFTGRTAAVDSVEVRARVWGYLESINFKEGSLVKKGDVLFEIDPRIYEANVKQAEANLESVEAKLKRLNADLARARQLIGTGGISREEFDKIAGEYGEAMAAVQGAKAAVDRAKLDLTFTKVKAPVTGRVGRALVTVGNLVQSGEQGGGTVLTTIVSVDPMYVYFDVDELTVLKVRQMISEGKAKSARESEVPVWLGLANEIGFPHKGKIDFVDNQINAKTGTLRVRGVFPNEKELLSPGLFARIRVPIGNEHKALLITDRALDNDQGRKIVYIVNENNEVVTRQVSVGALHNGLREVESGLKPGDKIIVSGLMHVRPGMTVEPKIVPMPTSAANGQDSTASNSNPN